MRRPTSQQSSFWGVLISLGIVLLIVFVFSQLPAKQAISPAPGGYPGSYPGPETPVSPTTASLETLPSYEYQKATANAMQRATLRAASTRDPLPTFIDKYHPPTLTSKGGSIATFL